MQSSLFVGRQAQLDQLKSHWQEAFRKKQGKVIFLIGEAGIGKTSLVEQFSRSVLANYSGVQVAYAQCDQVAGDISPYAPFVQILNSLTEQAAKKGDNWFVEYMREVGPDVLGMVPVAGSLLAAAAKSVDFVWQRRKQGRAAEADRSQFGQQDLFQQFTDTFRNLAAHKNPLLLCIDDWHWADTSSTNLLFHLARQLGDVPLLLLATCRPHDAEARAHPILAVKTEMERYSLCVSLQLDFLSRTEVENYLAQRFPEAHFAPDFIDWLLKTTSGNALFISEYLSLLVNEGLLTPAGVLTGELADLDPPPNVEAVIRTRLSYLDREARDMLAYGSVEGEQFTTLVLSRLLDIKPLSLLRKLRAIEETHHLIASLGQQSVYEQQTTVYRFVHALIYRTLHNMLEAEERIEISRLLLEWLSGVYQQANDITKPHLLTQLITYASEAKQHLEEARYALIAAQDSAVNYAHDEVRKQCNRGLRALEKDPSATSEAGTLCIGLLLRLGRTEELTGNPEKALEIYRQAEPLAKIQSDKIEAVNVLHNIGQALRHLGRYDEALIIYKESVVVANMIEAPAKRAQAYYSLGHVYRFHKDYDEALRWYKKALAIQEELGDKFATAWTLNGLGRVYLEKRKHALALKTFLQAAALNEEVQNQRGLAWNYVGIGRVVSIQAKDNKALDWYQKALAIWKKLGHKRGYAQTVHDIGSFYETQNDYVQALTWYREALTLREKFKSEFDIIETRQRITEVEAKLAAQQTAAAPGETQ